MSEVYELSPQRPEQAPSRVRDVISTLANFVTLIPEVNIQFASDTFTLGTQRYGAVNDANLAAELQNELDTIAKNAEKNLKDEGFKGVKVTPINFDCTPMGWGSFRNILYVARGVYQYKVS